MDPAIKIPVELEFDQNKLRQATARLEQQLKFRGPFAGMAADTTKFGRELDRATERVITLGTAFQLLSTATRTIREVANSTIQVEKALTDINSVFRLTNENLSKFSGNLFNIARETAKSFDEVAKAGAEFARQGLSVTKTQEAVRAAMILSRDANVDVAVSVKALTAAVNSFQKEGISYTQIINRLAAADSAFAVSSKDLQDALTRVGSAASDAGVSFNELVALVTSAQQITARGGSVIAGALNTIFTRINRRDTLDALDALGVAITDTQGRMLPTLKVLQNFSQAYDKMTGSVKNQAAELVGGVRQLNTLKAVLDDLSKTNSVFAQSLNEVENARDSAERRNAARNQSLSARLTQLQESGRQIGANVGTLGFEGQAKGVLSALNNNPVTEALRNAGDLTNESFGAEAGRMFIKGFGGAITFGLAPILATMTFQLSKSVFGNLVRDVKDISFIKNETRERAMLEQQIVALYQAGGAPLQQQLATMTSLTQQAAVFAKLMSGIPSGGAFQARGIVDVIMAQRGRPPRAAGGYIPIGEEAAAIAAGVGGAPMSARPVYLPNFNRGGGQKGIVANTSEFIVPNMAGGSAIFNREMIQKHGLPPGSTPVAAGGYIPNAADSWLGDAGLRGSGGRFLPQSTVSELERLFTAVHMAGSGTEARNLGKGIIDLTQSLSKTSQSKVLEKLGKEYEAFDKGLNRAAISARIAQGAASTFREYDPNGGIMGFGPGGTVAQSIAGRGFGDDYNDYLARRARGRRVVAPPIAPSVPPSLWSRMSGGMTPTAAMALSFGLPFAGANIDPGVGGTSSGMWRGAASSALNVAGFGASAGLMAGGPTGALIGAGAGAIAGGLYGAISKLTKSFEELTTELDQSRKKLTENYERASQFFRLQEELVAARNSGDNAKAFQIERQQTGLLASPGLPSDLRGKMLAWRNDPNALQKISVEASRASINEDVRASFLSSLSKIGSGDITSDTDKSIAFGGLTRVMAAMSPDAMKSLKAQIDSGNLSGALNTLSSVAGGGAEDVKRLTGKMAASSEGVNTGPYGMRTFGLSGAGINSTNRSVLTALRTAMSDVEPIFAATGTADRGPGRVTPREIARVLSRLEMESIRGGISAGAEGRLREAGTLADLNRPMTARERLMLEGQYAEEGIGYQGLSDRSQVFARGRVSLGQAFRAAGVQDRGLFGRLDSVNSLESALALQQQLRKKGGLSGIDPTKSQPILDALDEIIKTYYTLEETEKSNLEVTKQINKLKLEEFDLEKGFVRTRERILIAAKEEAKDAEVAAAVAASLMNTPGVSGSTVQSGLMRGAMSAGTRGDASGSFLGGFRSHFAGLRRDISQFAEIGSRVAQSLESNLGNAFGDFVTGAMSAKNAFRSFATSVLSDASRMFASKAVQSAISAIPGFTPAGATGGEFTGGGFRFAAGGMVPALLTGGEFYVSPRAAKRIGYDTLRQLNRYADGGVVRGGSGIKDDVPARLPPGSFIVRKSATDRLGADYLQSLVDGRVQNRWLGGFIGMPMLYGALAGAGLGYATGGKKGALIGAGIGAIGGGLYGMNSSPAAAPSAQPTLDIEPMTTPGSAASDAAIMMEPFKTSVPRFASTTPWWKTAGYGLGAAALLGLAARAAAPGDNSGPGPISNAQIPGYRAALEAQQAQMFSANRYAYLTVNPQGGYSLGSFGTEPATRRWASGGEVSGGVDMPMIPGPHSGPSQSGGAQVSVKIEINNNGQASSKSSSSSDEGPFGADFGTKLEKAIRPIVQDELVRQSRNDGFFSQRSRYVS